MLALTTDTEHPVMIPCENVQLDGLLYIPQQTKGFVIFAHGSGSSRFSPRNQSIARILQQAKFSTLLFDLLTPEEDEKDSMTTEFRFDIELLAVRLIAAKKWLTNQPLWQQLPIGYFGASTGGGAAIVAAARDKTFVNAIVSRGGRPDLAHDALSEVEAATLLIVGGNDEVVIELNQKAYEKLHCTKTLTIVPGATHLFEEPGKLAEVAILATDWFKKYLV